MRQCRARIRSQQTVRVQPTASPFQLWRFPNPMFLRWELSTSIAKHEISFQRLAAFLLPFMCLSWSQRTKLRMEGPWPEVSVYSTVPISSKRWSVSLSSLWLISIPPAHFWIECLRWFHLVNLWIWMWRNGGTWDHFSTKWQVGTAL